MLLQRRVFPTHHLCSVTLRAIIPAMTETTEAMGRAFRAARDARGWSLDDAVFEARTRFPALKIGRGQIHSMEKGVTRDRVDPAVVVGLAAVYDLSLSELDPSIADELRAISEAVSVISPCRPDPHPTGPFLVADAA